VLPYEEKGTGAPVLLLHAGLADRSMWREHLEWLADAGFRAIAPDLPGFGEARVTEVQAPWEDVLRTLRELELARVAIVGNSFGAAVALRVAAVAPAAVSALMLVSPPPIGLEPSPQLSAAWEAEEAALERGDIDGAVAAILDAWLPEAPVALRDRVGVMQRRAFERQMSAPEMREVDDPLEQDSAILERLEIPALATAGEADMPDFKTGAEQIANRMPRGQMSIIKAAGHLAPLEAPAQFRDLVVDFLRNST
jgi:3-oxoadipate enol-lactonase